MGKDALSVENSLFFFPPGPVPLVVSAYLLDLTTLGDNLRVHLANSDAKWEFRESLRGATVSLPVVDAAVYCPMAG